MKGWYFGERSVWKATYFSNYPSEDPCLPSVVQTKPVRANVIRGLVFMHGWALPYELCSFTAAVGFWLCSLKKVNCNAS